MNTTRRIADAAEVSDIAFGFMLLVLVVVVIALAMIYRGQARARHAEDEARAERERIRQLFVSVEDHLQRLELATKTLADLALELLGRHRGR